MNALQREYVQLPMSHFFTEERPYILPEIERFDISKVLDKKKTRKVFSENPLHYLTPFDGILCDGVLMASCHSSTSPCFSQTFEDAFFGKTESTTPLRTARVLQIQEGMWRQELFMTIAGRGTLTLGQMWYVLGDESLTRTHTVFYVLDKNGTVRMVRAFASWLRANDDPRFKRPARFLGWYLEIPDTPAGKEFLFASQVVLSVNN